MAAIKALEQWCKIQCEGYRDVAITNMTTSFKNGMAFCALLHKFRPDLIDFDSLSKDDVFENNNLAFQIAEDQLGIPALLDAEDMVALRIPDRLSILTYVSQYHNYFRGRSPTGGVGGVKRPAEGSKEEPSEKKNIPVVAKSFVSKTAIENRPPPSLNAETSPELPRTADKKTVLVENSNKTGTLNSKCVACKSHVHLVQRHFVEGKLYHRSCFKCSECSNILLTGAYKVGKEPGSFICNAHQSTQIVSEPPVAGIRTGPAGSVERPTTDISTARPAPRHSSVLSSTQAFVPKPVDTSPAPQPWTASAQRTQAARQKFFQSAAPEAPPIGTKLPFSRDVPAGERVSMSPKEQNSRTTSMVGRKLSEDNRNNNNSCPFVVRSSQRRFGEEPYSADRLAKCSQDTAGQQATQPVNNYTHNKETLWQKSINKASSGPTAISVNTKEAPIDWRSNLRSVKNGPEMQIPCSSEGQSISLKKPKSEVPSTTVTNKAVKPPSRLPPTAPTSSPPAVPAGYSAPSSQLLQQGSGGPGTTNGNYPTTSSSFCSPMGSPPLVPVWHRPPSSRQPQHRGGESGEKNGSLSPTQSPSCLPTMQSIGSPPTNYRRLLTTSGSKNGKRLSLTNASGSEMRSPLSQNHHIPMDDIVKELNGIEDSLSDLEREGVEMEKNLRTCEEEGNGDILMDPLMVDWFNLIRKKQMYIRRESELVYIVKTQDLEEQQPGVELELRRLLEKPDHLKSREECWQERRLMERLVDIVNGRNAIVEGLDKDRRREEEEDQQLNEMMQSLGVRKSKNKRKSSVSKLFRRRSKKTATE
ncbi:MICAL-like protein 2a [Osmerus eperlanus]|uniref:MICAL-like protein 2a n=1 Tax=Osmerus eperlanus TaxID=29151 RepID=UPI002E152DB0